jgi:hypothetical protein
MEEEACTPIDTTTVPTTTFSYFNFTISIPSFNRSTKNHSFISVVLGVTFISVIAKFVGL